MFDGTGARLFYSCRRMQLLCPLQTGDEDGGGGCVLIKPLVCVAMVELDGDDIRISSRGKLAERDIVQVTLFLLFQLVPTYHLLWFSFPCFSLY